VRPAADGDCLQRGDAMGVRTGRPVGAAPRVDVEAEIAAARAAQAGWAAVPLRHRLRTVRRARHLIAGRVDELVAAVDGSLARRRGETLAAEVLPLAQACRFLERRAGRVLRPRRAGSVVSRLVPFVPAVEVRREPFGVVLIVGPGNYPLFLPGGQVLQALAAGNAVVLKPGSGGRAAATALARVLYDAGLPRRALSVLDESVDSGRRAVESEVDKVVLTGSFETGRAVLRRLAARVVPATVELSGCDAVFVLPGAEVDLAARALAFGLRLNEGATCVAPRRVFAPAGMAGDLGRRLAAALAEMPACAPDPARAERVAGLVAEAESMGARLVTGRCATGRPVLPAVVADASPEMRLLQEDVFAPVLSIVAVRTIDEAVRGSAACPYALGASVFGDAREAGRLAGRIAAGVVVINDMIAPTADARVPFGGRGRSGYGVTRGAEGLLEMTRPKAIVLSRGRWRPHLEGGPGLGEPLLRLYMAAAHGPTIAGRLRAARDLLAAGLSRRRKNAGRENRGTEDRWDT
jgi:acyl-CoA reductase-like NAD-dependent aldehyde dehydrogenase